MRVSSVVSIVVLATGLQACSSNNLTLNERYPGPWRESFNMGITKALAGKHVRGCGDYKYRESKTDRGEYLVYCNDGTTSMAYIVWPNTGGVIGPNSIDPSLQ
jgi:hypothetical protein